MYTDRNGYLELFYPVAGWFWFLLSGILCLSIFICCLEGSSEKSLMGFNVIGQYSLFIYVVHTAIISFALIEFTTYNWSSNITGIIILMPFWLFLLLLSKILKKYFHKVKQIILIKPLFYILGL
jgi:fucose 4-O-acetylase-like acetyltransferase